MTNTERLRAAIPRAEALLIGIRELKAQLVGAAGAAPMDAEAAVAELVRTLRFDLRTWEGLEDPDDDLECSDEADANCCKELLADTGVKACWCPPMDDPSDPEQHEVGCLLATVIRIDRARARETPSTFRVLPEVLRRSWSPPAVPAGCYAAPWGWVHVKPGCRCPR